MHTPVRMYIYVFVSLDTLKMRPKKKVVSGSGDNSRSMGSALTLLCTIYILTLISRREQGEARQAVCVLHQLGGDAQRKRKNSHVCVCVCVCDYSAFFLPFRYLICMQSHILAPSPLRLPVNT